MIYHDNEVKFEFLNNVTLWKDESDSYGYFRLEGYMISDGQDPDHKITGRDYPLSKDGSLVFEIGRHKTSEVAKCWNESVLDPDNTTKSSKISEANFVLGGELVLNLTGGIFGAEQCICTIPGILLTQYGSDALINTNNFWQFGSPNAKKSAHNTVVVETNVEGDAIDVVVKKANGTNYKFVLNFFQRELDEVTPAYFIRAESKDGVRKIINDNTSIQLEGEFGKLRYKYLKTEYGEPTRKGIWDCVRLGLGKEKKVIDIGRIFRISLLNKSKVNPSWGVDTLHITHQLYRLIEDAPENIEDGIVNYDCKENMYEAIPDTRVFADLPSSFYIRKSNIVENEEKFTVKAEHWAYRDVAYELEEEVVSKEYTITSSFQGDTVDLEFSRNTGFSYKDVVTKQNSNEFIRQLYSDSSFSEKMKIFKELTDCTSYRPYLEYVFEKDFGIEELDMLINRGDGELVKIQEKGTVERPGRVSITYVAKYKVKKINAIVACSDVAVLLSGIYDIEFLGFKKSNEW